MLNSFVDDLSTFAASFSERGRQIFSSPLQWVLLANGDADFHDNVIFFGFIEKQDDPVLVAKVPRLLENGWMLQTEYDHLVELWNCIGEEAAQYVPKPYGMSVLQERPVLMISYVPGESLARLSSRSFWESEDSVSALAGEAARALRGLNRLTETPIVDRDVRDSHFQEKADKFRELFPLTPQEERALAKLVERVEISAASASHRVLIQGDFWHGNMIRSRGKLMLVDWQFAHWSADVSMDVYFFLLAGALSATRDAAAAFRLLEHWRARVIPEYLAAYGKPDHYALLPLKYGMQLCCVEKAVRPALEFGYSHPDDAVWRSLFTELMNLPDEE
ncbi:MAG TPA: aminoglycoside phosphotransferase family protein [Anaerolineales bacterium]|nr:aminoglycoside phosphotransferase family protein [Anaerolineales bacterium]